MSAKLLGRFDATAIDARFAEAGFYAALANRGFDGFHVELEQPSSGLPHLRLSAVKEGARWQLLDTCITEMVVERGFFAERGFPCDAPIELLTVYWLRQEDPTARFTGLRAALPLQRHPGLGVLRQGFEMVLGLARELGRDGVVCTPKFFHDAVIFYRSRLMVFLDPVQQGRFVALMRDLRPLPIGAASMLLIGGGVRDGKGEVTGWEGGLQVMPLSGRLCDYLNSSGYAAAVAREAAGSSFHWQAADLRRPLATAGESQHSARAGGCMPASQAYNSS